MYVYNDQDKQPIQWAFQKYHCPADDGKLLPSLGIEIVGVWPWTVLLFWFQQFLLGAFLYRTIFRLFEAEVSAVYLISTVDIGVKELIGVSLNSVFSAYWNVYR